MKKTLAVLVFALFLAVVLEIPVFADFLINVKQASLPSGSKCNANERTFIINQIAENKSPPSSITVYYSDGTSEVVSISQPLEATAAHYTTTKNLDKTVVDATAMIYDGWKGQFVLSHGPCPRPTPTKTQTSMATKTATMTSTKTSTATRPRDPDTPTPTATNTSPPPGPGPTDTPTLTPTSPPPSNPLPTLTPVPTGTTPPQLTAVPPTGVGDDEEEENQMPVEKPFDPSPWPQIIIIIIILGGALALSPKKKEESD